MWFVVLFATGEPKRRGEPNVRRRPGEPKSRAKKGTKGEGRWVVVSLGFHRERAWVVVRRKHPWVVNRLFLVHHQRVARIRSLFSEYSNYTRTCSNNLGTDSTLYPKVIVGLPDHALAGWTPVIAGHGESGG